MDKQTDIVGNLIQELRRGSLVLMILSQLGSKQYGYSLLQRMEERGVTLEPGTLYPLLRRLEKQGLLDSHWDTDTGRPRRYYLLSAAGRQVLAGLTVQWQELAGLMARLLDTNIDEI
jgi:DNA-binding PadR family transcriptional regulator